MQHRISSKGNSNHYPAGTSKGGQFAPKGFSDGVQSEKYDFEYEMQTIARFRDNEPNKNGEIIINKKYSIVNGKLVKNGEKKETPQKVNADKLAKAINKRGNIQLLSKEKEASLLNEKTDKEFLKVNLQQLNRLDKRYGVKLAVIKGKMEGHFGTYYQFQDVIALNENMTDQHWAKTIAKHNDLQKSHWYSEGDPLTQTLTHEYGHAVGFKIVNETGMTFGEISQRINQIARDSLGKKEKKQLMAEYNIEYEAKYGEGYEKESITSVWAEYCKENLSRYGATNPQEFFAEAFASYESGKSSILGNAMGKFLEENDY